MHGTDSAGWIAAIHKWQVFVGLFDPKAINIIRAIIILPNCFKPPHSKWHHVERDYTNNGTWDCSHSWHDSKVNRGHFTCCPQGTARLQPKWLTDLFHGSDIAESPTVKWHKVHSQHCGIPFPPNFKKSQLAFEIKGQKSLCMSSFFKHANHTCHNGLFKCSSTIYKSI